MTVKATAIKTYGLGCIAGDTKEYQAVRVEDRETYWNIVIHENRAVWLAKDAWKVEVIEDEERVSLPFRFINGMIDAE